MERWNQSHAKRWLCLVALLATSVALAVTLGSSVWDVSGATNTEPSSEDLLGAAVVTTSSSSGDIPPSSAVIGSSTATDNTNSAVGLGPATSSQDEATEPEHERERTGAPATASTGAVVASSSHEATRGALSCTGTLPRADASIQWDSPSAGDVLTADVWCPTTPTQLPSSSRPFRWCTVVKQGLDHAQHMRVSMSLDADGGRVDVVYHNCSEVLASTKLSEYVRRGGGVCLCAMQLNACMHCCQPKVDHRLRSEFGPGVFALRVRGPEYHALRFAYTPSTCTYTARFEVSLRGQYCLDTTLVYANYDAVVEVGYALQRWLWHCSVST